MHFSTLFASALMGAVASAQTVHVVSVGSTGDAPLTFSPNNVDAAEGDMIQFQFRTGNHTVTQSTFDQPCMPISMFTNNTGIYSGFQPVEASAAMGEIPTYTISIANTNPLWFYCSQGMHCQGGMVMVVNENTEANSTRSLDNFVQLAAAATVNLPGDATSIDQGETGTTDPSETTGADGTEATGATGAAAGLTVSGMLAAVGAAAALML
ncbi:hypothetical protein MKZ38_009970 [Zalerion maritima]|uniref:Extracellular serine-rich protein n=1 Tax=Zalerion maritima TaxID=339359 RepID=A0AAD5RSY1_9PEZI|nr:hypothetical protein MKZ38_009970 [Zalerion maritima]